jgi:hypothetical protein
MIETRLGRIVFSERGYIIAELYWGVPDGEAMAGFSLVGPHASPSIIYSSRQEALDALHDIEARVAAMPAAGAVVSAPRP